MEPAKAYSHHDYTVGLVCALPIELAAAISMLDVVHPDLKIPQHDRNVYTLGNIRAHNIVVSCCPPGSYGTTSAASVAIQMLATFESIRFGLMVGIGGGIPSKEADIRLGDIVVSRPTGHYGGVVQYDLGKASGGIFQRKGLLNRPPSVLLEAVDRLRASHILHGSQISTYISEMVTKHPRMACFSNRGQQDRLFEANYEHLISNRTCDECDKRRLIIRNTRDDKPEVHYGLIGSGNQVIKHGLTRDKIAHELGIICLEMEAAGLMNNFPCLVVRGICDYADSHKNKEWQRYAAVTAAAYAKELLSSIDCHLVSETDVPSTIPKEPYLQESPYCLHDYTIGIICPSTLTTGTVSAMLDQTHPALPIPSYDTNCYQLGSICGHNVVINCLPSGEYGSTSAASVAIQMLSTFKSIRFGLLVGIGSGVPSKDADIRLGDVVVSLPTATFGGVVQYDSGKTVEEGRFQRTGVLNKPPQILLRAVGKLQADCIINGSHIPAYISEMVTKYPRMACFTNRGQRHDCLFEANYEHPRSESTCDNCDKRRLIIRNARDADEPEVHYGLIGSGNQLIRHGPTRDKIAHELGILCLEMEAAGLMDNFPCLVIQGICDYADSHRNKEWQRYAAATAAAYAKRLLAIV
jgi:nucleoside phosphorylase